MRRMPAGPLMAAVAILLVGLMASAAIVVGALAFVRTRERAIEIARNARAATEQNVRARYDDCRRGDQLRAALRARVQQGRLTEPLLYRLVPSLDTPQVRKIIRDQRAYQLRAFAPVPGGCATYALQAVPPAERDDYQVP